MRLVFIILLAAFITGCATTDSNISEKGNTQASSKNTKKEKPKEELQDVQTIDKSYGSKIRITSYIKKTKAKIKCSDYSKVKVDEWRKLLESGWSCIKNKNWPVLEEIANILSRKHIKAAWGPYYKSIIAEKQGDLMKAQWMINLAERKAPNNPVITFQKARLAWLQKDETQAFDLMKAVLKQDAKNLDAAQFLGEIHFRDRQFKEAINYLTKTLKYMGRDSKTRLALAESHFELGKYKESLAHYKTAISLTQNNADLWMKMGLSYQNLKNYERAKSCYEQAINQKRKGRALASLSDQEIRKNLSAVNKIIEERNAKKQPAETEKVNIKKEAE